MQVPIHCVVNVVKMSRAKKKEKRQVILKGHLK